MSAAAASLMIRQRHRFFRRFLSSMAAQTRDTQSTSSTRGEKLPSLMVSSSAASSPASRCLYKLTKDDRSHISNLERHHHDLTLPAGIISYDDYRLAGSSRGFLIFSPKSPGGDNMRAINPLTGAHFPLPPVHYNPDFDDTSTSMGIPNTYEMKVILSPSLDTAVLLREARRSKAEFARLPSSSSSQWTPFSLAPHIVNVQDCIFHKNRLFIIDKFNNVVAFDEDVFAKYPPPSGHLLPSATWSYDDVPMSSDCPVSFHLVESPDGDDIFLVFRCATFRGGLSYKAVRWWVYKFNEDGRHWKPVESIGDSALFMGSYGGMFLPVPRHGSCVLERDCVYFTDRFHPGLIQDGLIDTGIYRFEEATVEFLPVTDVGINLNDSPPVWIPPAAC